MLYCGVQKVRLISHALHPSIFEQPSHLDFFNTLLDKKVKNPFVNGL